MKEESASGCQASTEVSRPCRARGPIDDGAVHTTRRQIAGAGEAIPRGGRLDIGVRGHADLAIFGPTWGFDEKLLGAHAAASLLTGFGQSVAAVSGHLTGPRGVTVSAQRTDTLTGFADLFRRYRWLGTNGVNNFMAVLSWADISVGAYDQNLVSPISVLVTGHRYTAGAYT
jgi:hypothetical protein